MRITYGNASVEGETESQILWLISLLPSMASNVPQSAPVTARVANATNGKGPNETAYIHYWNTMPESDKPPGWKTIEGIRRMGEEKKMSVEDACAARMASKGVSISASEEQGAQYDGEIDLDAPVECDDD